MIPSGFRAELEMILSEKSGSAVTISGLQFVGGGCINNACRISSNAGSFFLKWNDAQGFPGMFEAEEKGLQLLGNTKILNVPHVIACGKYATFSFLLLEWMEAGTRQKNFWQDFGTKLAMLHRISSGKFGLDHDNYIGSLPQSNSQHQAWSDFFICERIQPQLARAVDSAALGSSAIRGFDRLFKRLPEIFPDEKPALLHGDVWSGNFMTIYDGHAGLIDPAVYYGHREMDMAMTRLFGGFDQEFYASYQQAGPLEKGFESRVDICNLYPLLVHVNLFGGSYGNQVLTILKRFK